MAQADPQKFLTLQWKVAPALAAGNTIVLKPSEVASLTCLELGSLATEAGLPAGVLNVITGLGADCGGPLRCCIVQATDFVLHSVAMHLTATMHCPLMLNPLISGQGFHIQVWPCNIGPHA